MCRTMSAEDCCKTVEKMNAYSSVPLLVAANLEQGGNGVATVSYTHLAVYKRQMYIMDRERPEGGIFAKEIVQKYNLSAE